MYDLLLKGGRIYDGSGMPSSYADVGIRGGKIVEIGRLNGGAKRTLNVDGLAVAPGFIDPHTHLDAQLFWDPLGTSSCFHGVTSVIIGNCGLSLAPTKPQDRDAVIKSFVRVEAISRRVLEEGIQWKWKSTAEYLDALGTRLGINAAALIGHIAVRHNVMGEDAVERQAARRGEVDLARGRDDDSVELLGAQVRSRDALCAVVQVGGFGCHGASPSRGWPAPSGAGGRWRGG